MPSPFGYSEESFSDIYDGAIVRCILLERHFPMSYFKTLEEKNKVLKQKSSEFGNEYIPEKVTYKDGGIAWRIAVIAKKRNENEWSKTYKELEDGSIELPKYNIFCTFQQIPPSTQLTVVSAKGFKYGDLYREGGGDKFIKGNLAIIPLTPSVNTCRDNSNKEISYEQRTMADNIPAGREDQFAHLLAEEATRKREWKSILEKWETITENERLKILEEVIARRLLIGTREDDTMHYIQLEPGIIFDTIVEQNTGSKGQFNIRSIENWQKDADGRFKRELHSSYNCKPPNEKYKLIAKEILKAREISINEYAKKKDESTNFDYGASKVKSIEVDFVNTSNEEEPF